MTFHELNESHNAYLVSDLNNIKGVSELYLRKKAVALIQLAIASGSLTEHAAFQALDNIDTILPGETKPNMELVRLISEAKENIKEVTLGRTKQLKSQYLN